jgi:hypothetical protein
MQNHKHVVYYSCKLNSTQKNYTTTMEKELISVIAMFEEFHTMLFGIQIVVYTDH